MRDEAKLTPITYVLIAASVALITVCGLGLLLIR
jgi:hypothetical protein